MKTKNIVYFAALSIMLGIILLSCTPFSGPLPKSSVDSPYAVQHVPFSGNFDFSLDIGAVPKTVYFVFTNTSTFADAPNNPLVEAKIVIDGKSIPAPGPPPLRDVSPSPEGTMDRINEFNRNPFAHLDGGAISKTKSLTAPPAPLLDTVGGSDTFSYELTSVPNVAATCRAVIPDVPVAGGKTRTLNIWVADDCWTVGGSGKSHYIDQTMVDAMAAEFLVSSLNNDVYDWVSTMLGDEWGAHGNSDLIPPDGPTSGSITILLYDIDNDNSDNGGITGFFWAKDNFKVSEVSGSNERIMFYIDAVMYANPDGTWDPTDFWPQEMFSTLAHEFQHMIHFYQKQVLQNNPVGSAIWINEMCSLVVEDLLADKMAIEGPRGVTGSDGSAGSAFNQDGRLPRFNFYNDISLIDWGRTQTLASYSISYAFGAYLARNFGGAGLIRDMVTGPEIDHSAVTNAVAAYTGAPQQFGLLLRRWASAVLLSDKTDAPVAYRYNTGDFLASSVGGTAYQLGSINLFNYRVEVQPSVYLDGPFLYGGNGYVGAFPSFRTSSIYYQAGDGLAGSHSWSIELPTDVVLTAVLK